MRVSATSVFLAALAASTATAQSVVGSAYGFATGVTGGGSALAVTPTSADELADLLGDDTPRTIVIGQEFDFTGTTATDSGCDRKSCSASNGGQLYLGDLSCGGDDNVAVSSITYDVAGTEPLLVGSNKSILGANGQGVLKGKGLRFKKGASNIIVQGLEITDLNPGIVWGGDAIDFQGSNDGVWVDHCKVSLVGRMFAVSHYDPSRITLSNNEFDGRTTTSASCDDNHYWTMMFYGDGDQVTLDRNYFHHVSGRAPKLGQAGTTGTFQASNNYFADMKGHAFDAADGATAILEGNVFESVKQPMTAAAADVSTIFNVPDAQAAEACAAQIGRACVPNAVDSSSGELPAMSGSGALQTWSSLTEYLVDPVDAADVAGLVSSGAGPANLGSSAAAPAQPAPVEEAQEEEEVEETPAQPQETEEAAPVEEAPVEEAPVEEAPVEEAPIEEAPVEDDEDEYEYEEDCTPATPEQPAPIEEEDDDEYEYEEDCTPATPEQPEAPSTPTPEPEAPSTPEPEPVTGQEAQPWGQCGGNGWTGATKCAAGTSCVVQNDWYSQCLSSAARRKTRALRHVA